MAARSIGTATIAFGLVSIPVKLFTSSESDGDISFNLVHQGCGSRLKQQYTCIKEGVVVERDQMSKGYEFAKGQYVTFSADELKALDAVANHSISLSEFVPAATVDPLFVEKTYYLGPDKGGERAYQLIGRAMLETGLVGIASYAARGKQYIVLVRPYRDGLVMHQLRYAQEIKDWADVPIGDGGKIADAELGLAKQIIQQIAADSFVPEKYKDEVRERMQALIDQKVAGQEITVAPQAPMGKVVDLLEALKASLGMDAPKGALPADAVPAAAAPTKQKRRA